MQIPSSTLLPQTPPNLNTDTPTAMQGRKTLEQTAKDFETAFLAEALGHMGLDAAKGVKGADAFSSFINRAYAEGLVARGGTGLSESIVRALAAQNENS